MIREQVALQLMEGTWSLTLESGIHLLTTRLTDSSVTENLLLLHLQKKKTSTFPAVPSKQQAGT